MTDATGPQAADQAPSQKYICKVCGYIYDPEKGDPDANIAPGTAFADIPEDWFCPECGAGKESFGPIN